MIRIYVPDADRVMKSVRLMRLLSNNKDEMTITLQIDQKMIKVKKGISVLDSAHLAEIYIPTLCHHPQLNPAGSCRLCVVEIKGMRGYPTACTTPAENGMIVQTDTSQLRSLRRQILELTLSEHPYTCLVCDKWEECGDWMGSIRKVGITTSCQTCPKSGSCELQHLVRYLGIEEIAFPIVYRGYPVEQEDPFFDRDYNLCILCGRCVRVCNEIRYNGTLNFNYRGDQTVVGTAFGRSHLEVGCEFCGACVDVCPTGALYGKGDKWEGCSERSQHSICPCCSVGCSLDFHLQGNRIIRSTPSQKKTLNQGQVCVRGRFSVVDMVHHTERILKPMVKRDGKWIETSWKEAIDWIAKRFSPYQGDSFGLVVSPHSTNEDAYALQKFGRVVMQSQQIVVSSPFAQNRLVEPFARMRQFGQFHASMDDIDRADLIVIWGGDFSVSHPIAALKVKQSVYHGAKLVVVDARKTKLARLSDMHMQLNPGQDLFLLVGLLKAMFDNHEIKPKPDLRRSERDDLKKKLDTMDLSLIEKKTGIARKQMKELIHLFLNHRSIVFIFGAGLALQESAQDRIFALSNLTVLIDHAKIIPVVGENNLMGSLEMGCCSGFLPGLFSIGNMPIKRRFEKAWGVSLQKGRPFNLTDLIDRIGEGEIKALYMTG
ncbi:molybdopterin-dependent oxidoreductase [bacterium]|nr:molybdopterin-dependent oxidoreductase [bacterium]